MSGKTIFWVCVAIYYAVVLVRFGLGWLAERRLAGMSPKQRASYIKYWRWCH